MIVRKHNRVRYVFLDCLRARLWDAPDVEWCYAQNMLAFVRDDRLASDAGLRERAGGPCAGARAVVHPRKYLETIDLMRRLHATATDIATLVRPGETLILVDDAYIAALESQFGVALAPQRTVLPFLEHEGRYWGPAPDSATAIGELERIPRDPDAVRLTQIEPRLDELRAAEEAFLRTRRELADHSDAISAREQLLAQRERELDEREDGWAGPDVREIEARLRKLETQRTAVGRTQGFSGGFRRLEQEGAHRPPSP